MVGGVTGSVNATTYTASSDHNDQVDVSAFTVAFTAISSEIGLNYKMNTDTADSDPGVGKIKFNVAPESNKIINK